MKDLLGLPPATIAKQIAARQRIAQAHRKYEPADTGLFSDDAQQSDLVDRARAAAGEDQVCVRCHEVRPCPCSKSWMD
jgi:hypothetical protein